MGASSNSLYTDLRDNVALNLLKQFGFSGAILVKSNEVYDPITGTVTTPATLFSFPCLAGYGGGYTGKRAGVTQDREGNTLVRGVGKSVFLDASKLTITPITDDFFVDEFGNVLDILNVTATNPGGVTVLWRLTVKQ